jgi:hypothetical protein
MQKTHHAGEIVTIFTFRGVSNAESISGDYVDAISIARHHLHSWGDDQDVQYQNRIMALIVCRVRRDCMTRRVVCMGEMRRRRRGRTAAAVITEFPFTELVRPHKRAVAMLSAAYANSVEVMKKQ